MRGENILQTIQKIATFSLRLDEVTADQRELKTTVNARLEKLEAQSAALREQFADLRERLARLEASREADRAQMQADLARFMAEVERAELRLVRRPSGQEGPTVLPEERVDET